MEANESVQIGLPAAKKKSWLGATKYFILMILCCAAPIVAVSVLTAVGVSSPWLRTAVILVCPISMGLMMFFVFVRRLMSVNRR